MTDVDGQLIDSAAECSDESTVKWGREASIRAAKLKLRRQYRRVEGV